MRLESDDRELRARFQELRDEVSVSAPLFAVVPHSSRKARTVIWKLATVGTAVALAVVVLLTDVLRSGGTSVLNLELDVVAWTAPSDFLLETPGRDLLRSLPVTNMDLYLTKNPDPQDNVPDTAG